MRAGGATVEVISNESTDPNAENFVGKQFNIATALATNDPIQLYTLDNEPVDIWVTVELVSEAQEAVVAMTQTEWLASLKGADGVQGAQGPAGADGKSAFELAQADGFTGTQSEWLETLKGPKGDTGTFDSSTLENYALKQDVIDNEKVTAAALNKLNEAIENISLTTGPQGEQGPTGPKGDKGDTGTFDSSALANYATQTYVNEAISRVVGEAPEAFDTLKEIADALNGTTGENAVDGIIQTLAKKANTADVNTALDAKANTDDVYSKTAVNGLIGELGNKSDEQGTSGETGYVPAVPYTNVMDVIKDNEEVTAAALADLQAKYEALLARIVALEDARGETEEGGGE